MIRAQVPWADCAIAVLMRRASIAISRSAREEVMRHKAETTELIDLHGGALLPGFVEPHLHLDFLATVSFFTDLSPCLPARYETRKDCQLTLFKALGGLKRDPKPLGSTWMVGFGIGSFADVSRRNPIRERLPHASG